MAGHIVMSQHTKCLPLGARQNASQHQVDQLHCWTMLVCVDQHALLAVGARTYVELCVSFSAELGLLLVGRPLPGCWLGGAMLDACPGAVARAVPCWVKRHAPSFGRLAFLGWLGGSTLAGGRQNSRLCFWGRMAPVPTSGTLCSGLPPWNPDLRDHWRPLGRGCGAIACHSCCGLLLCTTSHGHQTLLPRLHTRNHSDWVYLSVPLPCLKQCEASTSVCVCALSTATTMQGVLDTSFLVCCGQRKNHAALDETKSRYLQITTRKLLEIR
eukprot:1782240-Amphidinium_carterae.2